MLLQVLISCVQSLTLNVLFLRDVNTAIMELLVMSYALKTSCANNIIGVIPYFPYSKQCKMRKRGSIVCKLLAAMLAKAGMDSVFWIFFLSFLLICYTNWMKAEVIVSKIKQAFWWLMKLYLMLVISPSYPHLFIQDLIQALTFFPPNWPFKRRCYCI